MPKRLCLTSISYFVSKERASERLENPVEVTRFSPFSSVYSMVQNLHSTLILPSLTSYLTSFPPRIFYLAYVFPFSSMILADLGTERVVPDR